MKFIKLFDNKEQLDNYANGISHRDGAFILSEKKKEKLSIIDERHPGPNCIYVQDLNMSPLSLESNSSKDVKVGSILYVNTNNKLTLNNEPGNMAIAICVCPSVTEDFEAGNSTGESKVKTARFCSLYYMNQDIVGTASINDTTVQFNMKGYTIGNTYGNRSSTSYIGGKKNTQILVEKSSYYYDTKILLCNISFSNSYNGVFLGCNAAVSAAVYSIRGTKRGDWYLPSVGELKEMYSKISIINPIRKQLVNEEYKMQGHYWTSYEYNADNESAILFTNGAITYADKKMSKRVIPFLAVSI